MPPLAPPPVYCAHRFLWGAGTTPCRFCGAEPRLDLLCLSQTQRAFRNHVERECVLAFLYLRDGPRCAYCEIPLCPAEATVDHVQAWATGGANALSNFVMCCRWCNRTKGENSREWLVQRDDFRVRAKRVAHWWAGEPATQSVRRVAGRSTRWLDWSRGQLGAAVTSPREALTPLGSHAHGTSTRAQRAAPRLPGGFGEDARLRPAHHEPRCSGMREMAGRQTTSSTAKPA